MSRLDLFNAQPRSDSSSELERIARLWNRGFPPSFSRKHRYPSRLGRRKVQQLVLSVRTDSFSLVHKRCSFPILFLFVFVHKSFPKNFWFGLLIRHRLGAMCLQVCDFPPIVCNLHFIPPLHFPGFPQTPTCFRTGGHRRRSPSPCSETSSECWKISSE